MCADLKKKYNSDQSFCSQGVYPLKVTIQIGGLARIFLSSMVIMYMLFRYQLPFTFNLSNKSLHKCISKHDKNYKSKLCLVFSLLSMPHIMYLDACLPNTQWQILAGIKCQ